MLANAAPRLLDVTLRAAIFPASTEALALVTRGAASSTIEHYYLPYCRGAGCDGSAHAGGTVIVIFSDCHHK